ncbi:hypothetical protein CABS01_12424, partial [Colletotrichum abscissum]|uniref:uncharacterized protein n=1 Tax=Colletotrichum abscissum TaxID=1671311 RepID=UPI0027D6CEE0
RHPHLWATEIFPSSFCTIPLIAAIATGPTTALEDTHAQTLEGCWWDSGWDWEGRAAAGGWEASVPRSWETADPEPPRGRAEALFPSPDAAI